MGSKVLSEEQKSSPVDGKEFDKLLINCQEILMDLGSLVKTEEKAQTPPSTPEEFHDAKEAISASASFADRKDVEIIGKEKADDETECMKQDDDDVSSSTKDKVSFV